MASNSAPHGDEHAAKRIKAVDSSGNVVPTQVQGQTFDEVTLDRLDAVGLVDDESRQLCLKFNLKPANPDLPLDEETGQQSQGALYWHAERLRDCVARQQAQFGIESFSRELLDFCETWGISSKNTMLLILHRAEAEPETSLSEVLHAFVPNTTGKPANYSYNNEFRSYFTPDAKVLEFVTQHCGDTTCETALRFTMLPRATQNYVMANYFAATGPLGKRAVHLNNYIKRVQAEGLDVGVPGQGNNSKGFGKKGGKDGGKKGGKSKNGFISKAGGVTKDSGKGSFGAGKYNVEPYGSVASGKGAKAQGGGGKKGYGLESGHAPRLAAQPDFNARPASRMGGDTYSAFDSGGGKQGGRSKGNGKSKSIAPPAQGGQGYYGY